MARHVPPHREGYGVRRTWAVAGTAALLVIVIIVVIVNRSSSSGLALSTQGRLGDSETAFAAAYGAPIAPGLYRSCPGATQIPTYSITVQFNASGRATSIQWRPCAADTDKRWQTAVLSFLPLDAVAQQQDQVTGLNLTMSRYASASVGASIGMRSFSIAVTTNPTELTLTAL
jgi:hypothetical protein